MIGVAVNPGSTSHARIDINGNTLTGSQYNYNGSYYNTVHRAFNFTEETIDGQAMIKIPAMYYKRADISSGTHGGKSAWWVADYPEAGFALHPAFMKNGSPVSHFYVGKYQASLSSGKLSSVTGVLPQVNREYTNFLLDANARNVGGQSGWMMWSVYQLAVIQMLFMIELASTDSQSAMGSGRVSQSTTAAVNAADVSQATYRGVVGLWGNILQLINGFKYQSSSLQIWDKLGNKTYSSTGITPPSDGNSAFTMNATNSVNSIFYPLATSGITWPDGQYTAYTSDQVPAVGGAYNDSNAAGLWYLSYYSWPSRNEAWVGTRLAKEI